MLILEVLQALYVVLNLDNTFEISPSDPNSMSYKFECAKGLDQLEEL